MTVLTSSKRAQSSLRRRRSPGAPVPAAAPAPQADAATVSTPVSRRRRELGPEQDQALYTCSCGYVFHAEVSTSVGCPHCGGTQAW